jgi:hypothetical protein
MRLSGNKKSGKPHAGLRRAADEAARSFVQRSFRSQMFSREIARRRSDVGGAGPLSFVSSQLGNKFVPVQTRALDGERIYQHPGQLFRHTSYNSVTQLCMSFNFTQLARSVQLLLGQFPTMHLFARGGNSWIENKTTSSARAGGELPQVAKLSLITRWPEVVQSLRTTESSLAVRRLTSIHLKPAAQWSSGMQLSQMVRHIQLIHSPQSLLLHVVERPKREVLVRLPSPPATKPAEAETHAVDRLFTLKKLETWNTERTQVSEHNVSRIQAMIFASVTNQAPARTTHVRYLADKSLQPRVSLDLQWLRSFTEVTITGERLLSIAVGQSRSSAPPLFFTPRNARKVQFAFEERPGLPGNARWKSPPLALNEEAGPDNWGVLRQITAKPRSLDAAFAFVPRSLLRTLTKHSWLSDRSQFETSLLETKEFETKRFKAPAPVLAAGVSLNLQPASELILVHKEGASRAPSMDFVFAQAFRRKVSEERVVKHLEQREIVELVRKEVKQSMTRASPLHAFTREDYVEISDHVYSNLMKRLTVERERLGLR